MFGFLNLFYYINIMSENNNSESLGLGTILFLIFLTLKLGGWGVVATWSWIWIFSPLWIPLVFVGVVAIVAFIVYLINQ